MPGGCSEIAVFHEFLDIESLLSIPPNAIRLNMPPNTFHGLPGLLADSLPDKFGNALIDAWVATQGGGDELLNGIVLVVSCIV